MTYSGQVVDASSSKAIPMVAIGIKETNQWLYTNSEGRFKFTTLPPSPFTLQIRCLGYQTLEISIIELPTEFQTITLHTQNLNIQEITVTATEKQGESGTSVIDQQAMQHLQPSGFGDLLELLPGYRWEAQDLSQTSTIKLRQAGDDANTALGTAFYIDGIPLTPDAELQGNNLSSGDLKLSGRLNAGQGIDLRSLATDDIERVEIIRGLPSVKYGNLSTGAVILNRKWGASPLNFRAKADLKNKVLALNKGFTLKEHSSTLNLSTEILSYKADPRNPLENYMRSQSTLKYARNIEIGDGSLIIKGGLDFLATIDREKEDPELNYGLTDTYKHKRNKTGINLQTELSLPGTWNKNTTFKTAVDYSQNKLTRERMVSLTGPQPQPIATTTGKSDALYLPTQYMAWFERDDQPLNTFTSLDFNLARAWDSLRLNISTGAEWRNHRNLGQGDRFDPRRPISPGQGGRPYNFSKIPTLHNLGAYIETELSILLGKHQIKLRPGVRLSSMTGLSQNYAINGIVYDDWRTQATYSFSGRTLNEKPVRFALHTAWGQLSRMPNMVHLYPQEKYRDIVELNYFSQNPDLRRLYVLTTVEDVRNYDLKPARNLKKEIGMELRIGTASLSVTAFEEEMQNGIVAASSYKAQQYDYYEPSSVSPENLDGPPALSLFSKEVRSNLFSYTQYTNGATLIKRGIEYQLQTPKISSLHTRISISGAWFKTCYDISLPEYIDRSFYYGGKEYPYVGVFNTSFSQSQDKALHNTNLQADTHLTQHRLLLSLSLQTTWYEKRQYVPYNGTPVAYLDNHGIYHTYNQADASDPMLRLLQRSFTPYHFDEQKTAIDLGINLKVRKEIGDNLSFAFYVNRLLNYLPEYQSYTGATVIRNKQPYFGIELKLTI